MEAASGSREAARQAAAAGSREERGEENGIYEAGLDGEGGRIEEAPPRVAGHSHKHVLVRAPTWYSSFNKDTKKEADVTSITMLLRMNERMKLCFD
jgi:hypothetical protein